MAAFPGAGHHLRAPLYITSTLQRLIKARRIRIAGAVGGGSGVLCWLAQEGGRGEGVKACLLCIWLWALHLQLPPLALCLLLQALACLAGVCLLCSGRRRQGSRKPAAA